MTGRYVDRAAVTPAYNAYQNRYATEPRESDKVLLDMIAEAVAGRERPKLLDVGCSTGNLLAHLSRRFDHTQIDLVGGDVSPSSLDVARQAAPYAELRHMNILDMRCPGEFDIIVANAVTYHFTDEEYGIALANIARSLKPRGISLAFEWAHDEPWQHLAIKEITPAHLQGVMLYSRPQAWIETATKKAGFAHVEFRPFNIPIDLPRTRREDGAVNTHTIKLSDGRRLSMRGEIYQPWCFVMAMKNGSGD